MGDARSCSTFSALASPNLRASAAMPGHILTGAGHMSIVPKEAHGRLDRGRWHRPNGRPRFYASERRAGEVAGRARRKIGGNAPLFEAIGMTCVNILCTNSMVPRRILWSRRPSRWALQASRLISSPPPSLTLPLKHRTAPPAPRRPSCRGLHPRGPPSAPPDGSEPLSLGPAKAASERRGR